MLFLLIFATLADKIIGKLVLEWSIHRGYRQILLTLDKNASGLLRFGLEAALAEAQSFTNGVRT